MLTFFRGIIYELDFFKFKEAFLRKKKVSTLRLVYFTRPFIIYLT